LRIRSNEWGYSVSFFIPYENMEQPVLEEVKSQAV
jgi:hypothetical protein